MTFDQALKTYLTIVGTPRTLCPEGPIDYFDPTRQLLLSRAAWGVARTADCPAVATWSMVARDHGRACGARRSWLRDIESLTRTGFLPPRKPSRWDPEFFTLE